MNNTKADIQSFYDLSKLCDDDIEIVAKLIYFLRWTPTKLMMKHLEQLKLNRYESDINFIMDNFKINTIKNLCEVLQIRKVTDEH